MADILSSRLGYAAVYSVPKSHPYFYGNMDRGFAARRYLQPGYGLLHDRLEREFNRKWFNVHIKTGISYFFPYQQESL